MLTNLPLEDSSTSIEETLHAQDIDVSKNIISRQLSLSRPTPLVSATLVGVTQTSNAGHPKPPGAYHFDSSSSTHLQCQRINASQPTQSKPYCTNRREEEGLTWPFTPSRAVHNRGVDNVRKRLQIYKQRCPG